MDPDDRVSAGCGRTVRLCALDPGKAISQYIRTVWTTDSGLPQTSIYSIAQTADGYLWVGTEQGLARFDGVRFTVFNRENTPLSPATTSTAFSAPRWQPVDWNRQRPDPAKQTANGALGPRAPASPTTT